ncbi:hypothetical protein ACWDTT_29085 [Streptosporangium sandarakinum]|uniref:Secreted protein n=1 Tax=Streptosporangium sandarakinum TaxID=1260955 RepID=A0A852UR52_9ACTN|nr:hypothetical protein [Streptosporangium sandarakinum]NYF38108.1 hypothetical protein [Streptosporangium sandarakinum]
MIRSVFRAGAAALATTVLLCAPAPAGATPRSAAGNDVYRDWYWTHSACVAAGQGGIDRGHWETYTCSEGDWLWHLWTNR